MLRIINNICNAKRDLFFIMCTISLVNEMERTFKLTLLIGFLANFFNISLFAQDIAQKGGNSLLEKDIYTVFLKNNPKPLLKDSSMVYAFSFKINILKHKDGKSTAINISANDSTAYTLFPNYKLLYKINYSPLLGIDKKATLIIPLFIYTVKSDDIKKQDQKKSLITMDAAINALYQTYTSVNSDEQTGKIVAFRKIILSAPVVFDYATSAISGGPGIIK